MKVLISAYACEPGKGSEPGAGWEWSRAAALDHDVWVLTRENNAPAIKDALAREPHLRMQPVYLDLPRWALFWKRGQRGVHLYYFLWQILVWRKAKALHREIGFDVAHHLTLAVDWMPAGVAWVRGLPLVWGPVGGATGTPWRMWRWLGWRGILSEAFREVATRLLRNLFGDPVARSAALVVAQNHDVARRFRYVSNIVVEPNVAIDPAALPAVRRAERTNGERRAVFAGRLIPWKGARLAVAALAEPRAEGWRLDIFGDGPERRPLQQLTKHLRLHSKVTFHGARPRIEVLAAVAEANAFLFPSMHDEAGWAAAEAVTLGCPVICFDRGGPPTIVGPRTAGTISQSDATPAGIAHALDGLSPGDAWRTRWLIDRLPAVLATWYPTARCRDGVLAR